MLTLSNVAIQKHVPLGFRGPFPEHIKDFGREKVGSYVISRLTQQAMAEFIEQYTVIGFICTKKA